MKQGKVILKVLGINAFIASKTKYNDSVNANDFYKMIERRTAGTFKKDAKELAYFLRSELNIHYKDFAQYQ